MSRISTILATLLAIFCLSQSVQAQSIVQSPFRSGTVEVHFAVINSLLLQPQIAQKNGLLRSGDQGLLTLVARDNGNLIEEAHFVVTARTLLDKEIPLQVRHDTQGGEDYFLAQFPIAQQETLNFDVQVQLPNDSKPLSFRFSKELYPE